ncbi:MAG: hypothetical protein O3A96_12465, partial [Proteobacteria bacterium]|nr:hypothetical protein [Pseudomonadota bacterium]
MVRRFALPLLWLFASAPALAADSDTVRVNASRYQAVPEGVAVSISFADPAQKDENLELLLADRLLIGGHEVIGTGGYNLVVDYDAPQRSEDDKTFQLEHFPITLGHIRLRRSSFGILW